MFRKRNAKKMQQSNVSIDVPRSIIERIRKTISKSNVEEGGKFLGNIETNGQDIHVNVNTFIDSGPGVSKSQTHIVPDGEYQETIYRLVEFLDPSIEHIGTWHSHHCNGLESLSEGDVRGYYESVNHRHYNGDYFLVMLVVSTKGLSLDYRLYLFIRGRQEYMELDPTQTVSITASKFFLESLLIEAEKATGQMTRDHRSIQSCKPFSAKESKNTDAIPPSSNTAANSIKGKSTAESVGKSLLAKDNQWFRANYVDVQILRNKASQSISWVVERHIDKNIVVMRYEHIRNEDKPTHALLKITVNGKDCLEEKIKLDHSRYGIVKRHFLEIEQRIAKDSQIVSNSDTRYNHRGEII